MHAPAQIADLGGHFRHRLGILLFNSHFQKDTRFLQILFQVVKGVDPLAQ